MKNLWVYDVYIQLCEAGWDRQEALLIARWTVAGMFN